MNKGSARDTFVVGILLSFPGATYIAGMDELSKQHISNAATVLAVLAFTIIQLVLLEVPLLGYAIRPESTNAAVQRFSSWLSREGVRIAVIGGSVIGIFLVARGAISLVR